MRGKLAKKIRRHTDFVRNPETTYVAHIHKIPVMNLNAKGEVVHSVEERPQIFVDPKCDRALYKAVKSRILRVKRGLLAA